LPLAKANGVDLYYEQTGDRGDPVLLIHGSWSDHTVWSRVVQGLAANFRVVSYDRRGHGKSQKVTAQGSGEEDAADASALLIQLGATPAHVVGNSSGASVALKMAVAEPSSLRSLNAHEPPLWDLLGHDPLVMLASNKANRNKEQVARELESGDRAGAAKLFMDMMSSVPGMWDRMTPEGREMMIANADTWLDEIKDPNFNNIDLTALARFTRPALLTYGGKGMQGPRMVIEKLAKTLPNSKVQVFPNDGHSPHLTNPQEFMRVGTEFARSVG
jgi:pimeloyl-ACP methyl ester carboxylesterase